MEKDQRFFLINNKGICIVVEPNRGNLLGYTEVVVSVTVYNDICGEFHDALVCDIEGLEPKRFPTQIAVSGSPIIVDKCQIGIDFKTDYPTLNLGATMTSHLPIVKTLRLRNTSPKPSDFEWKMFSLDGAGAK